MSQAPGELNPVLSHGGQGLHWALGMLAEGAQILSMPPALVHFVSAHPQTFQN